jgi:hypothetical protein
VLNISSCDRITDKAIQALAASKSGPRFSSSSVSAHIHTSAQHRAASPYLFDFFFFLADDIAAYSLKRLLLSDNESLTDEIAPYLLSFPVLTWLDITNLPVRRDSPGAIHGRV